VRIAVGPDPVSGHSRYRSLTVHGDRETAQAARERWAAQAELVRSSGRSRPGITLAALLREWLCADHGWRPSTVVGGEVPDAGSGREAEGGGPHPEGAGRRVRRLAMAGVAGPDGVGADEGIAIGTRVGLRRTDRGPAPPGRDAQPATCRRADACTGGPGAGDPGVRAAAGNRRGDPGRAESLRQRGPASGRADAAADPVGRGLRCPAG